MDNCTSVVGNLLTSLKLEYTKQFLEDNILAHPEHPSLLTVSDTLLKYNIDTVAVRLEQDLEGIQMPCIVQLSDGGGVFHVLTHYSDKEALLLDDKGKHRSIPMEVFMKAWTGVCLLVQKTEHSGEPGIKSKKTEKRAMSLLGYTAISAMIIWMFLVFFGVPDTSILYTTLLSTYALLKSIGLVTGAMILWYEVDQFNPTLQSFCSSGKKINCDSVLNSKHAKIFNGKLSVGLIGFTYFFATLGYLLINGFSTGSLAALAYMSVLGLPVVAFSAYFQGVVIKQWCKFCIVVQLVLIGESMVVYSGGFLGYQVGWTALPLLLALLLIPILVWKRLKPLLEMEKDVHIAKRQLKKIKNNPAVFHGLLAKNRKFSTNIEGLGISFNDNRSAKYHILKVCNPYCGPCAVAHSTLEELVEKDKINLQILFNAPEDHNDYKYRTVSHLLAIDEKHDKKMTHDVLSDWYASSKKSYEMLSQNHPMNGELAQQHEKIKAMQQWCKLEKITHTPTIFINGHELPREYSVDDLKEILA